MIERFDMQLIEKMLAEYIKATKKRKGEILSEYCRLTRAKRSACIKRFIRFRHKERTNKFMKKSLNKKGPKIKYGILHKNLVFEIWELSGHICAERIHPMIEIYLEQLKNNNRLISYNMEDIELVRNISVSTLKRIIKNFPRQSSKKHKGNHYLYKEIPIIADFGKYAKVKPGYIEIDFVEHKDDNSS